LKRLRELTTRQEIIPERLMGATALVFGASQGERG